MESSSSTWRYWLDCGDLSSLLVKWFFQCVGLFLWWKRTQSSKVFLQFKIEGSIFDRVLPNCLMIINLLNKWKDSLLELNHVINNILDLASCWPYVSSSHVPRSFVCSADKLGCQTKYRTGCGVMNPLWTSLFLCLKFQWIPFLYEKTKIF